MGFFCFWKNVPAQVIDFGSNKDKYKDKYKKKSLTKITPIDIKPKTGKQKTGNVTIVVPLSNNGSKSLSSGSNKSPAIRSASSVSRINPNLKLKQMTILLVDDSVTILKLTKNAIENVGHIVVTAKTGLEAKNMMLERDYDIVLMDIQMPIMGGIEATRLFREFEKNAMNAGERVKKQLIIGMSAAQDYEMWQEALRSGMDDFIAKPFKFYTFTNVVASLRPEYVKTDKDRANTLDSLDTNAGSKKSDNSRDSQHTDKGVRFLDAVEKYVSSNEIKNVDNVITNK